MKAEEYKQKKEHDEIQLVAIQRIESDESLTARIRAAQHAQSRSRVVFLVCTTVSLMLMIASYNAYLSFDYDWALRVARGGQSPSNANLTSQSVGADGTVARVLREQALREWAQARSVSVALLGIKINVDDAPIVGSIALLVISVWFALAARRENHTIGYLLRDTRRAASTTVTSTSLQTRWRVFHSVVSETVFTNYGLSLWPVDSLDVSDGDVHHRGPGKLFTILNFILIELPVIAIGMMLLLDRLAYTKPTPFSPSLSTPSQATWLFSMPTLLFSLLLLILTALLCTFGFRYHCCTGDLIFHYYTQIRKDLKALPAIEHRSVPKAIYG